jgi:hypothetical protein
MVMCNLWYIIQLIKGAQDLVLVKNVITMYVFYLQCARHYITEIFWKGMLKTYNLNNAS